MLKCQQLTSISMINKTSEIFKARNFFICRYFSFYEQMKFCAQLSWAWIKFYNLRARVAGSSFTAGGVTVLWSLSRTLYPLLSTGSTHEQPNWCEWKIVYWDIKNQTKQTKCEQWHDISNNVVCATSKGSDQPAHSCSLIRAFVWSLEYSKILSYWLDIIWSFYA